MNVELPSELKSSIPPTFFGRVLAATPVVMAVLATMLAGLASSEMTRAQYDRSLAAQQQSKAGDQWGLFQAKRLRGDFQRNTAELLQGIAQVHPLEPTALRSSELATLLDSAAGKQAMQCLQRGQVPATEAAPALDQNVQKAIVGMDHLKSDVQMAELLSHVSDETLEATLHAAQDQVAAFDAATKPVDEVIGQVYAYWSHQPAGLARSVLGDFTAARLRYTAARYEVESQLNQTIAYIYELQVRQSNISAARHYARSQKFFYGMLGAQLGVIVSTLAVAAKQRSLLWSLAAAAGLVAITFAAYVYVYV